MDPLTERPHSRGDIEEPAPDVRLVDIVDQALVRLDGLRDRPRLSSAVTALLVFTQAVGWGLTRLRAVDPIDDRIPRVDEMVAADVGPSDPTDSSDGRPESLDSATAARSSAPTSQPDVSSSTAPDVDLVVHVSGAVRSEGLVELAAGSRLADAITAAGGPTDTADVHRLNLATPLVDGMHIRVPELGEEDAEAARPLIETAQTPASDGIGGAAGGSPRVDDGPVNINQADVTELQRLPGVGPAIAGAIVAWREDNGSFDSIDDLLDVPGIGPAKLAAIEDQVVV